MALKAGFLIGGDTNETPQTLARKRALIAQIMANGRAPTSIGEGLNALGDGIVANVLGSRADKAEAAGQASANEAFAPIANMFTNGGFSGMPQASAPAPEGQPPIPGIQPSGGSLYGESGINVPETEAYIRKAAQERGIDPDTAVKVARAEGLAPNTWQSNVVKNGQRETSYGPFQLLVGGGLGDKFQEKYGKSPSDPTTIRQQIDFALDEAAKSGWSPWYGAGKVGVGPRDGIGQARALGFSGPIDQGMIGQPQEPNNWLRYANDSAVRNKPINENLSSALSFLPELGVTMEVFSGGQDATGPKRTGSTRHDHGGAADVFFYKDGRRLDWSNPKDVPIFQEIVRRGKAAGLTGFGAGDGYMQPGSMHLGFGKPAVWGAGGRGENAPSWLRDAYNGSAMSSANTSLDAVNAMAEGGQPVAPMSYVDPVASVGSARAEPPMAPLQGPSQNGLPFDMVSGSPQLAKADTRLGILRALTGQTGPEPGATGAFPAAPASAPMAAPQAAPAPSMAAPAPTQAAPAAPPAPQPMAQPQIPVQQLIAAINNPWLNEGQRAVAQSMLEEQMNRQRMAYEMQMKQQDPAYQMGLEKSRLEIDRLKNPDAEFITGRDGSIFRADKRGGTVQQVYGGKPDKPTDVQEYEYAKGQGYAGTFTDFQKDMKKAGASQVNIDQKTEGAFDKKLAEKQAEALDAMATEGMNARADLAVIGELGALMQGRGGTLDGISGALAKYGIGGEGAGDIQAAQALINRLVPTQRQPGSGSMSDRDVELFTRSLPSLWNQPGGNERILNTMRGLAQYKQAQGDIAQRVMTGELSRQDATKMLRELPNPLAGFRPETKNSESPSSDETPAATYTGDKNLWKYMTPEERALWK